MELKTQYNLKKYKKKIKEICLERYGVNTLFQSKEINQKIKQTCLERYGVENPNKNNNIKIKIEETNLRRYGTKSTLSNSKVKEKIKRTNLKKYGVGYPSQSKEIKEKVKQTCLEKYGVKNTFLMDKVIQLNNTVSKNNNPLFKRFAPKIGYVEEVRRLENDKDILEIKCKKCGKWFIPTLRQLNHRINSINGNYSGDHNIYCSKECKRLCPIYYKKIYQENHPNRQINRPYQQEWSQEVIENANYECEICSSKSNLVAHHVKPVKTHPYLQADIDNGICLCSSCHNKYGHKDECSTGNLGKLTC